jgi:hypothetical protein
MQSGPTVGDELTVRVIDLYEARSDSTLDSPGPKIPMDHS